nr:MAG TPA: hypothetical protein [Caudoviricetes sp.]
MWCCFYIIFPRRRVSGLLSAAVGAGYKLRRKEARNEEH